MELKKSMELQSYLQKLRKLSNKYKTIDDIIIFGSIVKGRLEPRDLDIALLPKNESELLKIKQGSTLGNHYHHYRETFYLLEGEADYVFENIETKTSFST